jgi:hypothetical protein
MELRFNLIFTKLFIFLLIILGIGLPITDPLSFILVLFSIPLIFFLKLKGAEKKSIFLF